MEKLLFDLFQLVILIKVSCWVVKGLFKKSKKRRKSIAGKVFRLISNRVHHQLDNALKRQKRKLQPSQKNVVYPSNVIPFRQTK